MALLPLGSLARPVRPRFSLASGAASAPKATSASIPTRTPAPRSTRSPGSPTPSAAAAIGIGPGDAASTKAGHYDQSSEARPSRSRQGRAGHEPGIRKAPLPSPAGLRLCTADGARKYVTASERETFLWEAERADRQVRTLCKKRQTRIFRAVPVSPALLDALAMGHGIRELQPRRGKGRGVRL
jgi:hypothetical protein